MFVMNEVPDVSFDSMRMVFSEGGEHEEVLVGCDAVK